MILYTQCMLGGSWLLMVLWHLMMVQLYYATGHQPTLTGVKLDAAFVGQHGDMLGYKLVLGGFLISLHTFIAQVKLNDRQLVVYVFFS